MPDKNIDKTIGFVALILAVLGGLTTALEDEDNCKPVNYRHIFFQTIMGGFSGVVIAFGACYVFGENIYLVGMAAGSGGVLGIKGVRSLGNVVKKFIEFNIEVKK